MKTLKTLLGIEYDLDFSFSNGEVTVTATVENGSSEFYFDVTEGDYNEFERTGELDYITTDLSEIEEWANTTETGYFASFFNEYCVVNSNESEYWCVSFSYFKGFSMSLYQAQAIPTESGICDFRPMNTYRCWNINQMNELINKLSK